MGVRLKGSEGYIEDGMTFVKLTVVVQTVGFTVPGNEL